MSVTKVTGMMSTGTKGGDIPSASTLVIDTDGDYFDITGTTGITAMTVDAGRRFTLQFDGAVTLTHGSSLYLPGAVNFTTEANDCLSFIATAANTVRCTGYALKDGGSPVAPAGGAGVPNVVAYSSQSGIGTGSTTTLIGAIQSSSGTHGYDASTGIWTCPSDGLWLYSHCCYIYSPSDDAAVEWELRVYTTGIPGGEGGTYYSGDQKFTSAVAYEMSGGCTLLLQAETGDTAKTRGYQNSGSNATASVVFNICRLGD